CRTRTSRVSGSPTAITFSATRGWYSGTGATNLARRPGDGRSRRDAESSHIAARGRRLAGPPGRPTPRRAADRRRRLPGRAELLDRLGARRAARDHDRTPGGRRGLALPRRRGA